LPSADISNLFELFFIQNYRHTPACDPPRQGTIRSFPTMPFLPSADISNLFELFFTQNYRHTTTHRVPCRDYQHVPDAPTYVPFFPIADISNLFELFFTQNYRHTPACDPPHQGTICTKAPSAPSPLCLFCLALIFQICLNYFLPKIIDIPPRST
jgi:hypothetical protein